MNSPALFASLGALNRSQPPIPVFIYRNMISLIRKPLSFLSRFGIDPFILIMFTAIFFAWLDPNPGSGKGTFSLSELANWGVSIIFFFYGLRLNWQKIYEGLANYRLHIVVQLSTFLLFPLIVLPFVLLFGKDPQTGDYSYLWLGIFFLATLPSTVSSSVVMVNIARGNLPAAIFNASISSLLGVFLTPVWMSVFITAQSGGANLNHVIVQLIIQVIVPILAGIVLHGPLGKLSVKYDKLLRKFDQGVIILIVYTAFCHSFKEKMFDELNPSALLGLSAGMVALFFVAYTIIGFICRLLKFNREDTITTLFCGSKKSLVHGTVMSQVILANPSLAGILILPTMIYHALQLIIVSIIAQRFQREITKTEETLP